MRQDPCSMVTQVISSCDNVRAALVGGTHPYISLKNRLGGRYSGYSYNPRTFMMEIYRRSTSELIAQSVFRSKLILSRPMMHATGYMSHARSACGRDPPFLFFSLRQFVAPYFRSKKWGILSPH